MLRRLALAILLLSALALLAQNDPYHEDIIWRNEPSNADWKYDLDEQAQVSVSLFRYGIRVQDAQISYAAGPDMLPPDTEGIATLENGQATISVGTTSKPGFRDLQLKTTIDGKTYRHHIKLGFEPEKLTPYTTLPDDFQTFWEKSKQEAALCPMTVERTFVPEFSSDKVDCYLVKIQTYQKGNYVYGYLTIPKKTGKFPAVLSPPGAGIKPMNPSKDLFYAENGFIRFDMEIHGIRPDLDAATYAEIRQAFGAGDNSYLVNGLDNRDSYYMKKVYLSCLRVLDFLTSLPEWDGKNLSPKAAAKVEPSPSWRPVSIPASQPVLPTIRPSQTWLATSTTEPVATPTSSPNSRA